ncbi:hypothetical protein V1291_001000 [Nitrobacteraceae bacterium AZCC 1564]
MTQAAIAAMPLNLEHLNSEKKFQWQSIRRKTV